MFTPSLLTKAFRNFFLVLISVGLVLQFLSPIMPILTEAAEKKREAAEIRAQAKTPVNKNSISQEEDKKYKKVEYDQSESNCASPVGWEEDDSKKEANIKYFWAPKNKDVPKNLTRSSNPEYFTTVICSYTAKINYKDKADGKFKDISNNLKEIDSKNPMRSKEGYKYVNSGNDFAAYFPEDPNKGWYFENNDGIKVKTTKVTIAGKKLDFNPKNSVSVKDGVITYADVLPAIDLQYRVDNEGVSKLFNLKNAEALKNDLSKIEFTVDSGSNKLVKKNDLNKEIEDKIEQKEQSKVDSDNKNKPSKDTKLSDKVKNNQELKPEDLDKNINVKDDLKNETIAEIAKAPEKIKNILDDIKNNRQEASDKIQKLNEKEKKELEKSQILQQRNELLERKTKAQKEIQAKIKDKKINSKDVKKIALELDKISELSDPSDSIELQGSDKIRFDTPVSWDAGSIALKADTFKISSDGKTITLYPDQEYLTAKERKFPITIDPRYITGNYTSQDTWYNSWNSGTNRNSGTNGIHLVVGGGPCINVGTGSCSQLGDTRTAIKFNMPGEVVGSGSIISARIRLRQYASNGGGFTMRVKNACDFNEGSATWNNQPCIAEDRGSIGVGTTNCGWPGCGNDRWSSDISSLLRDNLNGGHRNFKVVLQDDNESLNRGAVFCSKDGNLSGHPCNNGGNQGPHLQIYLNERPSAPNAELPDNGDIIGKCDKSVTPNTGNCNIRLGIDYKISNINDGDGDQDCNAARSRIVQKSNYTESQGWPWYPFWGPTQRGCPPGDLSRTYNIQTSNGKYDWAAINRDNNELESENWSNTRKFTVDSQPPVRVGPFSPQEFARGDKLNLKAPEYGDNILNKYWIEFSSNTENVNYLRFAGGINQTMGTNGSNVVLSEATGDNTHKWFLSTYQLKLEQGGRNVCLTGNPVENSPVTTTTCAAGPNLTNPNTTQNWIQKAGGQFALLANQNFCVASENGGTLAGVRMIMKTCDDSAYTQKFNIDRLTGTNRRMDVNNGGGNLTTNIHLWDQHEGDNQTWYLESNGLMRSVQGRCLSAENTSIGARVNYWDCPEDNNPNKARAQWIYTDQKELKNVATGLCMDVSGGNANSAGTIVRMNICSQFFGQKFNINKVPDSKMYGKLQEDASGLGDVFFLKRNQGKDISGDCISSGCNIHLWDHNGNLNQRFIYTKNQEIKPFENQSVCADATAMSNEANVYWFNCHGRDNQKWIFDGAKSAIRSKADQNFCIDNRGGGMGNGNNIIVWNCDFGQNQQWRVEFENRKLLKNSLDAPNQQLQYNAQVLKTATPTQNSDYYYSDIKDKFQSNTTIQFPNGSGDTNQVLPEGDVWVRTRARDRNQDGNANISEFTGSKKVTIDNSRPEINNFSLDKRVFGPSDNTANNLTVKFDVREKNFRNAQLALFKDVNFLDYQNSFQDVTGNLGEPTRLVSADGGQINQIVWKNNVYQYKTLDSKVFTRNLKDGNFWTDWQEINLSTNEDDTNSNTTPKAKRQVRTEDPINTTIFQNRLWQFMRVRNTGQSGIVPDNAIYQRSSADGASWSDWVIFPDAGLRITAEPNTVIFKGKMYLFFRGTGDEIVVRDFDGTNWSSMRVIGGTGKSRISATIYNNRMYIATRAGNDGWIANSSSSDGVNWTGWTNNGGNTPGDVSMVNYNGKLLQTTRALTGSTDNATAICNRHSNDGTVWTGWNCDGVVSTNKPTGFQIYNGKLFQTALDAQNKVYQKSTTDGINWSVWTLMNGDNSTEVVKIGSQLIQPIENCLNGSGVSVPCNYIGLGTGDLSAGRTLNFRFNPGNLAEGRYEVKGIVFDRTCTGDLNQDTVDNCNLSYVEGQENFIRVDKTAAKIGISEPFNGAWVSDKNFKIEGGVGGFNESGKEDRDISKLYICKAGSTSVNCINENDSAQDKTSTLNSLKNFTLPTDLVEGANYYRFRTKDSTGNVNEKVGKQSSNEQQDFWTINYETGVPTIDKIEIKSTASGTLTNNGTTNGSSDPNQTISFRFKDSGSDLTKISGIDGFINTAGTGYNTAQVTNPKGFNISLLRDIDDSGFKEIALYREGINITNNTDDPKLSEELKCTPEGTTLNSFINCTVKVNNLKLDGNYKLFLKARDRAGNNVCNTEWYELDGDFSCRFLNPNSIQIEATTNNQNLKPEFQIKTKTHLDSQSPKEAVNTVYNFIDFKGQAQSGNTISISNDKLNRKVEFAIAPGDNNTLVKEFDITGTNNILVADKDVVGSRTFSREGNKLEIKCEGNKVNHDGLSETKDIEYCTYSIRLNQQVNLAGTPTLVNTNSLQSKDIYGNSINLSIKVNIDVSAINLSSIPDFAAISPNGDGKFDQASYATKATVPDPADPTKTIDFTGVTSYSAQLFSSANALVWQKNDGIVGGKLPSTIVFDGNFNGQGVPDGEYNYVLNVTRSVNGVSSTISTRPLALSIKRTVNSSVVITSPSFSSEYLTSRGIVNVQGELPGTAANDEWKVNLCFKLVDNNNSVSANCVQNSSVNGQKGDASKSLGFLKPLTITNPNPTALVNYQTKLTIDTQALVAAGKLKNDCRDLRIRDTDQTTPIPFWIEKGCNTTTTTVWVKIPNLPTGNKIIHLSYGSAYATTSESNGNNVFEFWDDFNDLSKWTNSGATVSGGVVSLSNNQGFDKVFANLPTDYRVEARYMRPNNYGSNNRNRMYLTTPGVGSPTGFDYGDFDNIFWNGYTGTTLPVNTWVKVSWENTPNNYTWKFDNENGTNIFTRSRGNKINGLNRLAFGSNETTNQARYDWLLIRKFAAAEPTATTGSGETSLGSNDSFSSIVALPNDPARYRLSASATSKTGLTVNSDPSRFVPIRVDLKTSFKNITLTPSLDGLNTQADFNNFLNSTDPNNLNVNKLKSLNLNLKVSPGTEAVAIDFAKYSNLYSQSTSDTSDYSAIFRKDGRVALINGITQEAGKFNPNSDQSIKKNLYSQLLPADIGDTINYSQKLRDYNLKNDCKQDSCNWQYNMVYPYWLSGGIYELRLRAFKGDSFEEQIVAFEINGQTNTSPKVIRTDKLILTDRCQYATSLLASNPSNPGALGLSGDILTFAQNCSKQTLKDSSNKDIPNPENTEEKIKQVNTASNTSKTGYRYAPANTVKTLVPETIGVSNNPNTGIGGAGSSVVPDENLPGTSLSQVIYTNTSNLKLYLAGEPNKRINFRLNAVDPASSNQKIIEGKINPASPNTDVCLAQVSSNTPNPACTLYNQLNYDLSRNNQFETKDNGILEKTLSLPVTLANSRDPYVLTIWSCYIEPALLANGAINPIAGNCTNESTSTKYTHYKISVDNQAPNVDWVQTTVDQKSNPNATNPWIKSGDTVNLSFKSNKSLAISTSTGTSGLINQAGYKAELAKVLPDTAVTNQVGTTKKCSDSYSQTQFINQNGVDPLCLFEYQKSLTQTTSFTPQTDVEGSYYSILSLTDLAGNAVLYSNDTSVDDGTTQNGVVTNTSNANTPSSINTLDRYLSGLKAKANTNIQAPFFGAQSTGNLGTQTISCVNSVCAEDIEQLVFSTPKKIDARFLTDPTKKDASGNIQTAGLNPNQLAILNGVPEINPATNQPNQSSDNGKNTQLIPLDYPYSKAPVVVCNYPDPATNPANPTTPTNLPCSTDQVGNTNNASGSIRGRSLDFRLFVDNTLPDKQQNFLLTPNGDPKNLVDSFCDKDGIKADGNNPERDRLSPVGNPAECSNSNYDGTRFIVRGNNVTLKGNFEKNQRVALKTIKKDKRNPNYQEIKYYFPETVSSSSPAPSSSPTPPPSTSPSTYLPPQTTTGNTTTSFANMEVLNSRVEINPTTISSPNPEYQIKFTVKNKSANFTNRLVKLEFSNSQTPNTIVDSKSVNNITINQNQTQDFTIPWTPTANSQYLVKLKVFTPDGVGLIFNEDQILLFTKETIPAQGSGTTTNSTSTASNSVNENQNTLNLATNTNSSISSSTLTLYHDTVEPNKNCYDSNGNLTNNGAGCLAPLTQITYASPDKVKGIGTLGANDWNRFDSTNQTNLDIKTLGERKSDLIQTQTQKLNVVSSSATSNPTENKIELTPDPNTNKDFRDDSNNLITDQNLLKTLQLNQMGNEGVVASNITNFKLGKESTDEADATTNPNCITTSNSPVKNRRLGTCINIDSSGNPIPQTPQIPNSKGGDGLYTITERNIDTSGNRGTWVSKVVERDTVSPSPANLNVFKTGPDEFEEYLGVSILNNEGYSRADVTIVDYLNNEKYRSIKLDSSGNFSSNNMIGQLACGGNTYTVYVRLVDRAGNVSELRQASIITNSTCASCSSNGSNILINPIQTPGKGKLNDIFSEGGNGRRVHAGLDISAGLNNPVLAGISGTVERKGYQTNGWGNFIILKHTGVPDPFQKDSSGNPTLTTIYTIYAHLASAATLEIGQNVTTGQTIGLSGSTGASDGTHLHFQIQKIGAPAIPVYAKKTASGLGNVVDPTPYLPPFNGTVPTQLLSKYCPGDGTGTGGSGYGNGLDDDSDVVADYPKLDDNQEIAKNIATNSIINYTLNNFEAFDTDLEIWKDKYQRYINLANILSPDNRLKEYPNGESVNDIIKSGVFSICQGRVFAMLLGKNKKNNSPSTINQNQYGNDGMIIVNNFRKNLDNSPKAYLIKGDVYQKYAGDFDDPDYSNQNACEAIGLPNMEEYVATRNATPNQGSSSYKQRFDKGVFVNEGNQIQPFAKYQNNSIYKYGEICGGGYQARNDCILHHRAYYVVSKVADKLESEGSVDSIYLLPKTNTTGKGNNPYCVQNFIGTAPNGNGSKEIDLCNDLETPTNVFVGNQKRTVSLRVIQAPNGQFNKFRYRYDADGNNNRKVWIVAHGMKNSFSDMNVVFEAIANQNPTDIVLAVDWSGARDGVSSPTDTDQWIRPTAEVIAQKLRLWGFNNASNLNLIGHSMGTILINETAIALRDKGTVNSLYFLDPPNFMVGTDSFEVDTRTGAQNTLYTETNGYTQHYSNQITVNRAFTGVKDNGDGNWCGNAKLNRTAKESISVYLPDVNDIWAPPIGPCKIHGAVNQVFARLINDQKLTFDGQQKLNLNAIGVETYTDKTFYGDDYAFDASIQIRDTNDIQTIMTANPNNTNNFNIWGKPGGAIYQNFNNSNQNTKDGRTITIKNFGTNDGGWDRISLQKERKSLGVTQDTSSYLISQSNNIQRTVTKSIPTGVNVNQYTDIVVEGSRVGNMLPGEIEAKMNQFKAGTDNDWFTKR